MTVSDPLDRLPAVADLSEDPAPAFKERLLSDLVDQLYAGDDRMAEPIAIVKLHEEDDRRPSDSKPRYLVLGAVAAALVALGIGFGLGGAGDDQFSSTESADENGQPATGEGISYATARALVEGAGGVDGLVFGEVEEKHPWHMATFDPLDNHRLLLADVDTGTPVTAELWTIDDGAGSQETLPWLEANAPRTGGTFQRDGTILLNTDPSHSLGWPILTNDGNLLARPLTQNQLGLVVSEGERPLLVSASLDKCPTYSVQVGGPEQATLPNQEPNGFARVAIPEPGVAMADPLPDYPLDGMTIAHAAVSGDGSKALVLSPDGTVSILSMSSGVPLGDLTTVEVGELYNPLALNTDGTIAAIATSAGQVSVWHTNSGQLLFEISGDERPVQPGLHFEMGPRLAYDATRAAVLDAAATKWTIYTLDPAEWVDKACANGLALDQYAAELESLGMKATC